MLIRDISNHDSVTTQDSVQYDGIIIKATEGVGCIDPLLETYATAARASGKPWGLYHYLSFRTPIADQIAAFKEQMDKYTGQNIRPCLDVEIDSNINQVVPDDITDRIQTFCKAFTGCVAYADRSFLQEHTAAFAGTDVWQAEYGVSAPTDIAGIHRIGWQYQGEPDLNQFDESILIAPVAVQPVATAAPAPQPSGDPAVKDYQHKLNYLGIRDDDGNVLDEDGNNGPKTKQAVRRLESLMQLSADAGIWGPECQGAYARLTSSEMPELSQGSTGPFVRYVQYRVGTNSDGIFGQQTALAVEIYQRQHGLSADSIVGPCTWGSFIG